MRRKTIWSRHLKERSEPIDLVIRTKVPEKWIFVDTENLGIWSYSGLNEEGKMFKHASLEEIAETEETARRLLAELGVYAQHNEDNDRDDHN